MKESVYTPSAWQNEAHACPVDEMLGAGSAGVGKTLFLITDPIQQIQVEHDRCVARERWANGKGPKPLHGLKWGASVGWGIHLRRELIDLQQTMSVAARIYKAVDPQARWDAQNHTWIFKSGYRLTFGHCQNLDSHTRYLSFGFTWIGFDELTTFALEQYDGVTSRLRSSDPILGGVMLMHPRTGEPLRDPETGAIMKDPRYPGMLRIRACTNPGSSPGSDPLWVRKLWIDPYPDGRRILTRKIRMSDGTVRVRTRMFLPGKLADNPDPMFRETYEITLQDKPKHIREAYLKGDWYYVAGSYFGDDFLEDVHRVMPFTPPSDWPVWRAMDWGYKTAGIIGWWTMDEDGNEIQFAEWWFSGQTDREVAEVIKFKEQRLGYWDDDKDCSLLTGPADTQIWEQRGEHDTKTKAETFAEMGIDWVTADKKDRVANAQRVLRRMRDHRNRTTYPGVSWTSDCVRTIKAIRTIPTKKEPDGRPGEEPQKGGEDHPVDMVMYSCAYASRGRDAMPTIRRGRSILDEIELHRHKGAKHGSGTGYGSQYG